MAQQSSDSKGNYSRHIHVQRLLRDRVKSNALIYSGPHSSVENRACSVIISIFFCLLLFLLLLSSSPFYFYYYFHPFSQMKLESLRVSSRTARAPEITDDNGINNAISKLLVFLDKRSP